MLSYRDNYIRNAKLMGAEWIPSFIYISDASWNEHREQLEKVAMKYPDFFPEVHPRWRDYENYEFRINEDSKKPYEDPWGCLWETTLDGIIGGVTKHPLNDYSKLKDYKFPNFEQLTPDFDLMKERITDAKSKGELAEAGIEHGHYFLRLQDLRGFENLMFDMVDASKDFNYLATKVEEAQSERLKILATLNLDVFFFAEDLGTQVSSFISPEYFRKYVVPAYTRMIKIMKDTGAIIGLHSDGAIMNIMDDIINCGVDIINIQDKVNGLDVIEKKLKGKVCIRLDLDRQNTLTYGTPQDIDDLVRESVEKLGSKEGGLELIAGIYPPMPVENVDALCSAIKKYETLPFK